MKMESRLDNLLTAYNASVRELFADDLIGIYITGSIALGEFIESKSDADFTVLLKSPLDIEKLKRLKIIHKEISSAYRKIPLESQYITLENIRRNDADTQPFYSYHDNKISLGKHNAHAVTWFTLKNHGVAVTGIPVSELNITASADDIKTFVKGNVNSYWKGWLDEVRKPFSRKRLYALTERGVEWCVCGLARMYFTMAEGDITSKGKAAEYGLTRLPEFVHKILNEALRLRVGEERGTYNSRFIRRKDVIYFMDCIIELINTLH